MSTSQDSTLRRFPAPPAPAEPAFRGFYNDVRPADNLLEGTLVRAFLRNVPDTVYFKDRHSRFIAASTSLAKKHGMPSSDTLIGKTDFDTFSSEHAQQAFDDEQEIMRSGQPIIGKLEKETWPDGSISWVLTSKMPLRDETGTIVGTFGISKDVTEQKRVEGELETTHKSLLDASRLAGMAEVATGVLHNVGNVLNSVNVSTTQIGDTLRQSRLPGLGKAVALMRENSGNLGAFLTADPRGQKLTDYFESLHTHLSAEHKQLIDEVESLRRNVEHIKDIVSMQQSYAMISGLVEPHSATDLVEDAIRMNGAALLRHDVQVVREFETVPKVLCEKPRVLQILVNLIRNAKYALDDGGGTDKRLTLRLAHDSATQKVQIIVRDNGIGIPAENLTRIFAHGFTTRKDGHGFGLHSAANAAKEMKGSLVGLSDGKGKGATFILELPIAP
jgi:PAS domain S-box-containing protein